jgi:hypothetical protein
MVSNAGRGPALNIEARIVTPENLHVTANPPQQWLEAADRAHMFAWSFLEPGPGSVPVTRLVALLSYRDISRRTFKTELEAQVMLGPEYRVGQCTQRVYDDRLLRRWSTRALRAARKVAKRARRLRLTTS